MGMICQLIRDAPDKLTINFFVLRGVTMVDFRNLGTIGNLNFQGIQLAESIDVKIGELRAQEGNDDIANALKELTTAIDKENLVEEQRNELLEQIELLGDQASVPKDQRKRGQIKPIIDSLSGVCAGAGGLAAVWQVWGPVVMKFFGV
jgi:hypothetical protein